jgi:hypothetical protein
MKFEGSPPPPVGEVYAFFKIRYPDLTHVEFRQAGYIVLDECHKHGETAISTSRMVSLLIEHIEKTRAWKLN